MKLGFPTSTVCPSTVASHDASLEARITHVRYHLGDNMDVLGGLLGEGDGSVFLRIFKGHLARLFSLAPSVPGVPAEYALNHLVCDFVEAVRWWSRNRSYHPEDVYSFFCATSPSRA